MRLCVRFENVCIGRRSPTEVRIKPFINDATQRIPSATTAQTDTLCDPRTYHTVPVFIFLDYFVDKRHMARESHLAVASFLSLATYETVLHGNIIAWLVFAVPVMMHSTELVSFGFTCSFRFMKCVRV